MRKKEGNIKIQDITTKIGVFTLTLLATVFAVYFYSPVVGTHARVETDDAYTSAKNLDINVGVLPDISLTVSSENVNIPATVYSFAHNSVNYTVRTNSAYGYTVSFEDADNDTKLNNIDSTITDVLTSNFSGTKTSDQMSENTWGFSLDAGENYYSVPQNGTPVVIDRNTTVAPGTVTKSVDFGAKVGLIIAGTYQDTVVFTAYVNGVDGYPSDVNLFDKTTRESVFPVMQNFDCNSLETGQTAALRDSRDDNRYTVKKFLDGNCYMMQNLRIKNKTLTPADSNVASSFVLKNSNLQDFEIDYDNTSVSDLDNWNAVYDNGNYGVLYTWYAATAGSVDISATEAGDTEYESTYSICPANWKLPSNQRIIYLKNLYGKANTIVPFADYNYSFAGAIYPDDGATVTEIEEDLNAWSSSYKVVMAETEGKASTGDTKTLTPIAYYQDADDNKLHYEWTVEAPYGLSIRCMTGNSSIPDPEPEPDPEPDPDPDPDDPSQPHPAA